MADVVALCARDMLGEASFRAHGVAAGLRGFDAAEGAMAVGLAMVGAITALRLAAFVDAAVRLGRSRWRAAFPHRRRGGPRTIFERHRRR